MITRWLRGHKHFYPQCGGPSGRRNHSIGLSRREPALAIGNCRRICVSAESQQSSSLVSRGDRRVNETWSHRVQVINRAPERRALLFWARLEFHDPTGALPLPVETSCQFPNAEPDGAKKRSSRVSACYRRRSDEMRAGGPPAQEFAAKLRRWQRHDEEFHQFHQQHRRGGEWSWPYQGIYSILRSFICWIETKGLSDSTAPLIFLIRSSGIIGFEICEPQG